MPMQLPDQYPGPSPPPLNLDCDWSSSSYDLPTSCLFSPSPVSPSALLSLPDPLTSQFGPSISRLDFKQNCISYTRQHNRMPKRRTSLQAILIPPFLSYPLSNASSEPPRISTHARSPSTSSHSSPCIPTSSMQALGATSLESSRTSPPPDFLRDDDPFANHTGARPLPLHRSTPTSPTHSRRTSIKQPRSPLAAEKFLVASPSTSSSSSVPIPCTRSPSSPPRMSPPSSPSPISGRQLRPAYTRPAFAPRPSLPSLHSLAQSDFVYPIKARKGTLGARLPLEPWDVSSERESVLEEAPSFQGFDHVTDRLHLSESPLGPDPSIDVNELIHTGDTHANTADAWPCKDPHGLDSEASFFQPPISLELGPEEGPNMFASLLGVLSSFSSSSSSSLSRSSSSSSSSSVPVLSPDLQTQWSDDSPSPTRSPNRSSSEESGPPDFDEDIVYPPSRTFRFDDWHSENIDFLSVPGGFSTMDDFVPGTSAGTIRPLVNSLVSDGISTPDDDWSSNYEDYATPESNEADIFDEHQDMGETVDGGDGEYRSNGRDEDFEGRQSSNGRGNGGQDWRQVSAGGPHSNGRGSGGDDRRGGGSGDRRNDERDWGVPSTFSTPSDTESEDSEDEVAGHPTRPSAGSVPTSGDDDVPLARRIPTALQAQRTIRRQVRDEKDERRRQRLLRRQQRQEQHQQQRQQTHSQTLLDEDSRDHMQVGSTLSQGPTKPASSSARTIRPRTKTLPSNSSRPVAAEDLSRRLRDIQDALAVPSLKSHSLSPSDSHSHSDQLGQRSRDHARVPNVGIQDKSLRPTRSFHRPRTADATREQPMPMPALALETHRLGRSATTASRPVKQRDQREASAHATSDSSYRSTRRPRTSDDVHQASTALLHPSVFQRIATPRTPSDIPSPPSVVQPVPKETKQVSWQQRVFIVDLQRFNTLMMSPATTAKEVIDTLEAQGELANWAGVGGWMLFEVSQDFGMERPMRHFEVVSEVINSWDKDKSVNLLVAKKTPLATLLHPSAMPSSSPVFGTYVEWESKPRKWSKRWLELRDQGLWLSKKDNGKDEISLCSLANFDAYMVTRIHKSPKPYVFAVKSTDNFSFFENSADYVHVFCCSEKEGKKWLENVLLARSYFIHQERNAVPVGVTSSSGGAPSKTLLSSTITRKGTRIAQQPLVNVSGPTAAATPTQAYTFEPGSLLAKR